MTQNSSLTSIGFLTPMGSPHTSRTMMLAELTLLLDYLDGESVERAEYIQAIVEDNCLGKKTEKTRVISKRFLLEFYSLDQTVLLFRALRYFWKRDTTGQPLLALLCAYARDGLLRASSKYILPLPKQSQVTRQSMEKYLDTLDPGRYSPGKLASNAKNINSTWTQTGHLYGRTKKVRATATPTAGSVSYALLLGYLSDARGQSLFETEYVKLLDCPVQLAIELAENASRKGWITFKRVGEVIEVQFPNLINTQEMEWLREQS